MQASLDLLVRQIRAAGPNRPDWPRYGKLQGKPGVHHCHLNKGKPRYVAVWRVMDRRIKFVEVEYAGTHEKAPY